MPGVDGAQTRWALFRAVCPLFQHSKSLPTVEQADKGHYGHVLGAALERLKNEITTLRYDIKFNFINELQADIEQLAPSDINKLEVELESLLGVFEGLVDHQVPEDVNNVFPFPKLMFLRASPLKSHGNESNDRRSDLSPTQNEFIDADLELASSTALSQSQYIQFPQDANSITSCGRAVARFRAIFLKISQSTVGWWNSDSETQYYNKAEAETIRDAHSFASACASLFNDISNAAVCGTSHRAKLHLSGFRKEHVTMMLGTCQENRWISSSFTKSLGELSTGLCNLDHICSHTTSPGFEPQITCLAFNSSNMWEQISEDSPEPDSFSSVSSAVLNDVLADRKTLRDKHRKILGVLLASSLFQLYGTPWIQQPWGRDNLYIPFCRPPSRKLRQWCPHIQCTLSPEATKEFQMDDIAAFGVLLMELVANEEASWDKNDVEYGLDGQSNSVRLARILEEWEEDLSDGYRRVGRACLKFESLVATFDDDDIGSDLKCFAIIYKFILDPLFRCLLHEFGETYELFHGIRGPWGSLSAAVDLSPRKTAKLVLFDDLETKDKEKAAANAKNFMEEYKSFCDNIQKIGYQAPTITLNQSCPEKIRIAVLDSGIDQNDQKIRKADLVGRIKEGKSWVKSPYNQDAYGHGTHVTRLLLETAPAADIYIAKICNDKLINNEFMQGIAEAIDWTVEQWDVHIISISFGFEEENQLIDAAVERAIGKGKLVFAAASNNGGLYGRSRPARQDGVMCIHACDGLCNIGDMNPSPLDYKSNFATLGVAVPSRWKNKDVWKTGTSFATPIAAGFAADILEFANKKCNLTPERRKILHKYRGMEAVFRKMSEKRKEFNIVHPKYLWDYDMNEHEVARVIEKIVQGV